MILRVFLILYVLPLMAISSIALIFKKAEWVKWIWVYGTFAILLAIVFVKLIFSIIGLVE